MSAYDLINILIVTDESLYKLVYIKENTSAARLQVYIRVKSVCFVVKLYDLFVARRFMDELEGLRAGRAGMWFCHCRGWGRGQGLGFCGAGFGSTLVYCWMFCGVSLTDVFLLTVV